MGVCSHKNMNSEGREVDGVFFFKFGNVVEFSVFKKSI